MQLWTIHAFNSLPKRGFARNSTRNGKSIRFPKPKNIQLIIVSRKSLYVRNALKPSTRVLDDSIAIGLEGIFNRISVLIKNQKA